MTLSAEYWDRRYTHGDLGWTHRPHPLVIEELEPLEPGAPGAGGGAALDLGAGAGRHALWLARRGWAVTAVDFSAPALARTRELAGQEGLDVRTVQADLTDHQSASSAYGLILLAYVHPESGGRAALLAGAARSLAPGGRIVVVGHHPDNVGRGVGGPSDPEQAYAPEVLAGELAGLTVERAERVEHMVGTEAGARRSFATVVRARRPAGP
ncbi:MULTISPECIES: class I SAM-dependent methyltransferase [Actinomycetes]|uniref:class I SAM-dependent methyltransferase n=1 Tax=Actinomycetes TaxID=1760 RepID=UPI003659EBC6